MSLKSDCKFYVGGKFCSIGLATPDALPKACETCSGYFGPARGLGDVVHSIAKATGIEAAVEAVVGKDCGCKERRAAMNRMMPLGKTDPPAS